jgi:hypothetical protein
MDGESPSPGDICQVVGRFEPLYPVASPGHLQEIAGGTPDIQQPAAILKIPIEGPENLREGQIPFFLPLEVGWIHHILVVFPEIPGRIHAKRVGAVCTPVNLVGPPMVRGEGIPEGREIVPQGIRVEGREVARGAHRALKGRGGI